MKKLSESISGWLTALAATVLGLSLSVVVIYFLSSVADLVTGGQDEFEFTDIYARVAQRSPVSALCEDVVIVSVDGCSRARIAQVIDAVNFFSPSAVGLDLFFTYPSEEGELLASSIRDCDVMVLPKAVGHSDSESFFYGDFEAEYAAVNMTSSSVSDVVREYVTLFETDSVEYRSMAYALAAKAGKDVPAADGQLRNIWFPSTEFDIVDADELVDSEGFPFMEAGQRIKGKIVLIGVVNDLSDVHRTPVDDEMPGILIHAHVIDTILNDRHVNEVGTFWNIFIAFVLCLLFIRLFVFMKNLWDDVGEMVMSVVQLVLMYLFLVLGANLYIRHGIHVDFSLTVVVLGLSVTALSVINGVKFLLEKYGKK